MNRLRMRVQRETRKIRAVVHERTKEGQKKDDTMPLPEVSRANMQTYVDPLRQMVTSSNVDLCVQVKEAREYRLRLRKLMDHEPEEDYRIFFKQAMFLHQQHKWPGALIYLDKALELCVRGRFREQSELHTCRAEVHLRLGNWTKAMSDVNKVIKPFRWASRNKDIVKSFLIRGEALYNLCQPEDALVAFHRGRRQACLESKAPFELGIRKAEDAILNNLRFFSDIAEQEMLKVMRKREAVLKDSKGLSRGMRTMWTASKKNRVKWAKEAKRPSQETEKPVAVATKAVTGARKRARKRARRGDSADARLRADKNYMQSLMGLTQVGEDDKHWNRVKREAGEAFRFINSRQRFWEEVLE